MAPRELVDEPGRRWVVWAVLPTSANWRRGAPDDRPLPRNERRRRASRRSFVAEGFAHGWLTCETPGEKRRIAPIPRDWERLSDAALRKLCGSAQLARASRPSGDREDPA